MTTEKNVEKSYLEMLEEIFITIDSDTTIPKKDKEKLMMELKILQEMIWKYSA